MRFEIYFFKIIPKIRFALNIWKTAKMYFIEGTIWSEVAAKFGSVSIGL